MSTFSALNGLYAFILTATFDEVNILIYSVLEKCVFPIPAHLPVFPSLPRDSPCLSHTPHSAHGSLDLSHKFILCGYILGKEYESRQTRPLLPLSFII